MPVNPQILSANDGCICSVKGEEGPKDGERVLPRDRKLGENHQFQPKIPSFNQRSSSSHISLTSGARVCSASLQFPDEETSVLWSCDQGGLSGGLTRQS